MSCPRARVDRVDWLIDGKVGTAPAWRLLSLLWPIRKNLSESVRADRVVWKSELVGRPM